MFDKINKMMKIWKAEREYASNLDYDGLQQHAIQLTSLCMNAELETLVHDINYLDKNRFEELKKAIFTKTFEQQSFQNSFRMFMLGFAVGCRSISEYDTKLQEELRECKYDQDHILIRHDLFGDFWYDKFSDILDVLYNFGKEIGTQPEFAEFGYRPVYKF